MKIDLLTKQDLIDVLHEFRTSLIQELSEKLAQGSSSGATRWLKTAEVMKYLKCCETTLKSYRKNSKLNPQKISGTLFYDRAEVESLVQSPN